MPILQNRMILLPQDYKDGTDSFVCGALWSSYEIIILGAVSS